MGRIAAERADMVVLTNDNPRAEDPRESIEQITTGMPGAPRVEQDRALAILSALRSAGPAAIVWLAAQGHETSQETPGWRATLDDRGRSRVYRRPGGSGGREEGRRHGR